jgi:hypothetical protein
MTVGQGEENQDGERGWGKRGKGRKGGVGFKTYALISAFSWIRMVSTLATLN